MGTKESPVAMTWLLLALVVLAGGQAVGAEPPAGGAALLAAGDAATARLDLVAALAAYRDAHAALPESYEASWKLARALCDKATLSTDRAEQKALVVEAETIARRAVQLEPAGSKGHDYLAIALGKLALYEGGKRKVELAREVKSEAERALQLDPDDDLALHVRALWNREMVSLGWALRSFAQLLWGKLPPASLDAALADLRRAATLRPEVIPHHVELGVTLAAARRWAAAADELEKALVLPTGWVTDDFYRAKARAALVEVEAHLR
jgi:tetratricopeptide (TPR) repeat protein